MKTRFLAIALGCAALTGAPALAQHGHGGGGGMGGGHGGGAGGIGGVMGVGHGGGIGGLGVDLGTSMRTDARVNSEGPSHASPRAIERANSNSVLHGATTIARARDDDADDAEGHGGTTRGHARMHSQGPVHASARARSRANARSVLSGTGTATSTTRTTRIGTSHGITTRTQARLHSRGPLHASARARVRANANSVLHSETTVTTRGGR